jgi:hypothetical protein
MSCGINLLKNIIVLEKKNGKIWNLIYIYWNDNGAFLVAGGVDLFLEGSRDA